jgi:hypothetical protein
LDKSNCYKNNEKALEYAKTKALQRIRRYCYSRPEEESEEPAIIASGSGGYHLILPVEIGDLSRISDFTDYSADPNKEFLRFIEPFLCKHSDPEHYNHVSTNNCLLRVPGSINSKNGRPVSVVQSWNSKYADMRAVYGDFLAYLHDRHYELLQIPKATMKWTEYCEQGALK